MNIKDIVFLLTGIWAFGIGIRLTYELTRGDFLIFSFPLSFIFDWISLMVLGGFTIGIILYENTIEIRGKSNERL